jgi:hypothetical protein
LQGVRATELRPGLAGLLSRALEWRLRSLLYADADRSDVGLRPLIDAARAADQRFAPGYETDEGWAAHSPIKGQNRLILLTVIRFLLLRRRGNLAPGVGLY